jgi:hypothetical protein
MNRIVYITSLDGVPVDIVQPLPQYLFADQDFRMRAFLPQLIIPVPLVVLAEICQLLQYPFGAAFPQTVDQLVGGIGFEARKFFSQVSAWMMRCMWFSRMT